MGSQQTLANPFLHAGFVHPSLFWNSKGIRNDKVSRCPHTFEDHLRWKFGSICSDGKCHSEAVFFCSAGLNSNCSAAGELEGTRRGEFRTASASRPCWRCETRDIQLAAWPLLQTGETAQLSLPCHLAVAGRVLFLRGSWQSGVVSSFGTSQVKP